MAICSGSTHEKWWFSIFMLVYQRIILSAYLKGEEYRIYISAGIHMAPGSVSLCFRHDLVRVKYSRDILKAIKPIGTLKSCMFMGFSIINQPFLSMFGYPPFIETPIFSQTDDQVAPLSSCSSLIFLPPGNVHGKLCPFWLWIGDPQDPPSPQFMLSPFRHASGPSEILAFWLHLFYAPSRSFGSFKGLRSVRFHSVLPSHYCLSVPLYA